jgi:hypothetical protein
VSDWTSAVSLDDLFHPAGAEASGFSDVGAVGDTHGFHDRAIAPPPCIYQVGFPARASDALAGSGDSGEGRRGVLFP